MTQPIHILHVDDESAVTKLTKDFLERQSDRFDVTTATSPSAALDLLDADAIDCVVSDHDMEKMDGLEFLEVVRETHPDLPFILFTGKGSEELASDAISAGVTDYLQKGPGTDKYELLANRILNVVDQYRAEQALEETHRRFNKLLEYSTDVISVLDADGTFRYLTPSAEQILGYDPEEMIGECAFEYAHPDDRQEAKEKFRRAVEEPDIRPTVEFRFQRKDGTWIVLESRGRNMLDDHHVEGFVINSRDVTDTRQREQALREEQSFLRDALEAIPPAVYVLDTDLALCRYNDRLSDLTGATADELDGTALIEVVPDEARDRVRDRLASALETGTTASVEVRLRTDTGDAVPHVVTGHRVIDDGEVIGLAGTIRPVADRDSAERTTHDGEATLARIVAHDVRGGVSATRESLRHAREECDTEHHERVADELDRLETRVQSALERPDSDVLVDGDQSIALSSIASTAWQHAPTGDAELVVAADLQFRGDRRRIQQLLENLFRNAVEHSSTSPHSHTREDAVEHSSTSPPSHAPEDAGEHGGQAPVVHVGALHDGFYVEDDGPGIPPEASNRVFEAGYSTTDDSDGLGLAVVDRIARAHGFDVAVTSGTADGARFEVTGIERTQPTDQT